MAYHLQTATQTETGKVTISDRQGFFPTKAKAIDAAKRAAGRNARFFSDASDCGYVGPNGTVYVCEN